MANSSEEISAASGLTDQEAKLRLQQFGYNELGEKRFSSFLENAWKIFTDPMGLMLLLLSGVYWFLGKTNDAFILLAAYVPIVGVDVMLELRSQKALRTLRKSIKATCLVMRSGKTKSIPVREIVPGDWLILEEGQTLPADGQLRQVSNLTIDESSLTGESVPIEKKVSDEALSGTTVLTGSGFVEIQKTGLQSQLGSIAKVLSEFEAEPSPLLQTIRKAVKYMFIGAIGLAVLVFAFGVWRNHGWGESLVTALTLAMAAIPEEFPLVFTLYLSLAAYRLSKKGILVKALPSVEGLGRVDVICTDKTGTLTEGKFVLEDILAVKDDLSQETTMQALVFSCEPKAVDAMESAIFEYVIHKRSEPFIHNLQKNWILEFDFPFDPKDKYMSHVWREKNTGKQILAMKGAVEGVLARCDSSTDRTAYLKIVQEQAAQGKRLLGLAYKEGNFSGLRDSDEKNLTFLGVLSFADPVRPSVPAAIQECKERGIRLKMLTGDHLLTAHAIADGIGLPHQHDELFSGPDLEKYSEEERNKVYQKGAIFARLKPEQKLELVRALKSEGDIVAMTGDGINDAPALKLADIGISMGERATDVARSSAQMVLLKNDFGGIVSAIVEGQNVLKSLSESFGYLIAFHLPIILFALAQAFFFENAVLLPIHIVLLELIVHPVSAFVFSSAPSSKDAQRGVILREDRLLWSIFRGLLLFTLCLGLYFSLPGDDEAFRRSFVVFVFVSGNIGLLMAEAGGIVHLFSKAAVRPWLAAFLLVLLVLALSYVNPVANLFQMQPMSSSQLTMVLGLGTSLGFFVPILKFRKVRLSTVRENKS